jgi:hypothetical protein
MRRHALPLLSVLVGVLLGLLALSLPSPAPADAPGFSAVRAKAHIDAIAQRPHPVWEPASLVPVRAYIRARLEALGLSVGSSAHPPITDELGHTYPIENVVASIPGRSGASLMLVSHFDSSPKKRPAEGEGSRGAGDDGYGVATMLEIAELLARSKEPLANGVRFLFTDAEETGLWGARLEVTQRPETLRGVNFVIDLEARGIRGPALMFETGPANEASLDLYAHARRRFAYSFAVDVYRRMPNGTDFTVFLGAGYPGLNFAVIEDLSYYHTPRDEPANVSLGSLQHYGEQVLPVVLAYASDPAYGRENAFASTQDSVYFTWLPWVFLRWSTRADRVLAALLLLAGGAFAWRSIRAGRARPAASAKWLGAWIAVAFLAAAIGAAVSAIMGAITGIRWIPVYMPNVPFETPILWGLLAALGLACFRVVRGRASRGAHATGDRAPLIGAMALSLLALLATLLAMPGTTCLFSAPLIVALAARVLADATKRPWLALLGVTFAVSLYVPLLHLFAVALTFGALAGVMLIASFPIALAASLAAEDTSETVTSA